MTSQALSATTSGRALLTTGWELCSAAPGSVSHPSELDSLPAEAWLQAPSLGPVAEVLRATGRWSLDGPPRRFDEHDWWYRVAFDAPEAAGEHATWLCFDGLATQAHAWLNGEPLLHSSNMFVAQERRVDALLRPGRNQLVLRFQSLDALLAQKRARPRWRAPMVAHQQLRWHRTTLLGRTPGWSPPAAVVGPWKDIALECRGAALPPTVSKLHASLTADGTGRVELVCTFAAPPLSVELLLERGGMAHRVRLQGDGAGTFTGSLAVPGAAQWWPHTHGEPALYAARLQVHGADGVPAQAFALPPIGFRSLEVDTRGGRFSVRVNGEAVFCRGACWTPLDVVRLRASPEATRAAVAQVRDAGMNMLRVGGTMVYEEAAFFDACDEFGVLVWQDFMFANMDYPEHDAGFMAEVRAEFEQQARLWQGRASLAVLCGNSEGEQQAAMWGAPRELWSPPLFHTTLKRWVEDALPGVPYWPSSAHGGAFPHQNNAGTSSYYGVGAYLRPRDDARRSELTFATECLAFANVPDERTQARMPGGLALRSHHPGWKERTPRDLNAGWDFEDVRDHYFAELYRLAPTAVRSTDHERYLALSRAVTGELMAGAFAEWRRPGSACGGALVWFLRDLWAGAGWGLLDETGAPKACFHALRRALQPVSVSITDEGCNGLCAHVVNEPAQALDATLEATFYSSEHARVGQVQHVLSLPARGAVSISLNAQLDGFMDLSYAFRFGPPPVALVHARLRLADGSTGAEAFHFPAGLPAATVADVGLAVHFDAACSELRVRTERLAQSVHLELEGHTLVDNDFHLAPGGERRIAAQRTPGSTAALRGQAWALNAVRPVPVVVVP
jgi:beta-mannosidase